MQALSSRQAGLKQVKKYLGSLASLPGGVSPSLSPTFLSSRKRSANSCSLSGLPPPPQDIDSNLGYQVPEFPPPILHSHWVGPCHLRVSLKIPIPTLEETALRAGLMYGEVFPENFSRWQVPNEGRGQHGRAVFRMD